ncbi:Carboxysome shell and ethanolamine utilization microcompartment protein CcmL/EutN [[Eubacterium] yurii]|nr:Carboxysome shell and ethanolamine utilization microcompartment protein CcmL/EutN [[Eubacterium] yurii]
MQAIGLIETKGLIASIESADVMLKAADVKLISKTLVGGGLVTITVEGDVAAVKASVDAAVSAVERLGMDLLISNHVIPRPVDSIRDLFDEKDKVYTETSCENIIEDDIIKQDELEEETVITESHEDEISESVEDESHEGEISESQEDETQEELELPQDTNQYNQQTEEKNEVIEKFNIKSIDKKNFTRSDFEKIVSTYGSDAAQKVLESLNLTELRKLIKEYDDEVKGVNISKLSKAMITEHIMSLVK